MSCDVCNRDMCPACIKEEVSYAVERAFADAELRLVNDIIARIQETMHAADLQTRERVMAYVMAKWEDIAEREQKRSP